MERCYYCGATKNLYYCDYLDPNLNYEPCSRVICERHSVPEYAATTREDWTLCIDHSIFQHPRYEENSR